MNAISHVAPPNAHTLCRSILRRDRTIQVPSPDRRRRLGRESSVLRLVGHLATTAFVFVSFITLAWTASWIFSFLHSIHPFSDNVFQLFVELESVVIYLDAAACGVVLLFGIGRYILNVIKGDS